MRTGSKWFEAVNSIFLILCSVVFLYPLVYIISVSLSSPRDIMSGRVLLFPVGFNIESYRTMLSDQSLIHAFLFTVELTVIGTVASVALTVLTAYPLSIRGLKGGRIIFFAILFTMYFSGGLIPTYILVKQLGLLDKMGALILPCIDTFLLIITVSYMRALPDELREAAVVEGSSNFGIFFKIILPLSVPVIATLVIFYAVGYWNTYFGALLYMQSPEHYTLQIKLYLILNATDNITLRVRPGAESLVIPDNLKGATIALTIIPILVVYPWVQRYFIKGVSLGALKG